MDITITITIAIILILLAFFSGRNYGFDIGYSQGRLDGELQGAEDLWNELVETKNEQIEKYESNRQNI